MDTTTLYNMVEASAEAATNSANIKANVVNSPDFFPYSTYPIYVLQYNDYLEHVYKLFGAEAQELFPPYSLGKHADPSATQGHYWKMHLDMAVVRLSTLAAYLQSKIPTIQKEIDAMIDFIKANLRPSIFQAPNNEREVQNVVEVMLRSRGYDFRREKVRIPYSSKLYIPDFTFEVLSLALEMKFCDSKDRVKVMIDEMNGDISPYQTHYKNIIFAIYDMGFIRDVAEFKGSIERNLNVYVVVVKN